jgi:microcystin-dependent protein
MANPFVGEIMMAGFDFAPKGWAACDGASLPITQNFVLFTLISIAYGGDGVKNFNLPDLRGRLPMHRGKGHNLGEKGGEEKVTLHEEHVRHNHAATGFAGNGNQESPLQSTWAISNARQFSSNGPNGGMADECILPNVEEGGGKAHDNMMPYLTINFIINLVGTSPPQ